MNCADVRASLPELLYGRLGPEPAARAEEHVAGCAACQAEWQALQHVCRLLDRPAAPTVQVDLPALYRRAAAEQAVRTRRWRRAALAACGLAAALAGVAFGPRLEVRLEAHQVLLHWGAPPPAAPTNPAPDRAAHLVPVSEAELRLPRELIHALADDVDARDQRQQEALGRVQDRMQELHRQASLRLAELERHLAVLRAAQLLQSLKGEGNERTQIPVDGPGLAQHRGPGTGPAGGGRLAAQH
jgi:predicted anti-sigma-YlaC factor YlaD